MLSFKSVIAACAKELTKNKRNNNDYQDGYGGHNNRYNGNNVRKGGFGSRYDKNNNEVENVDDLVSKVHKSVFRNNLKSNNQNGNQNNYRNFNREQEDNNTWDDSRNKGQSGNNTNNSLPDANDNKNKNLGLRKKFVPPLKK